MVKVNKDIYDAVIIGAGVSGLVCGCYLAKAGMKVLIAEQHYKPGGYCTSFKRKGFTFDAAAHSFGSYREGGNMNRVFKELDLDKRLKIKRYDPSDVIITPDYKISFWNDLDKTIKELQKVFPQETKIREFFDFMSCPKPAEMAVLRNKTFGNLLDKYFSNNKLKTILSISLLINGGLPPSLLTAFTGSQIFSEFLLDGGYYPDGGMQVLPDALAERFKELGGTLLLSCGVKKIKIKGDSVAGVVLEMGDFIHSKYVISNCDARQTFLKLVGRRVISEELLQKLDTMIPSLSMFVLYLGISKDMASLPKPGCTAWFLSHYAIEDMYISSKKRNAGNLQEFLLRVSPEGESILAMVLAPFRNTRYWANNKHKLLEAFIKKIEEHTSPDLSKHIVYKDAATPNTLYRYTLNYKGAAYGWESIFSQSADPDFIKPPFCQNLYLTGHWTTRGLGIAGVTYIGYNTANLIIKKGKVVL
ncbi:MAG TPA: NAD(P)/FAD-dependent oxidoreductase [Clostridia bacterium]